MVVEVSRETMEVQEENVVTHRERKSEKEGRGREGTTWWVREGVRKEREGTVGAKRMVV